MVNVNSSTDKHTCTCISDITNITINERTVLLNYIYSTQDLTAIKKLSK